MTWRRSYLDTLRSVPLFTDCSKKELEVLSRLVEEIDYAEGTVVFRQGSAGREFFTIISGKASVTRDGAEIAVLGPGDSFGELALLDRAPRNATVTAATDLRVAVLCSREFAGALAEVPSFAAHVMAGMARRLNHLDTN